MEDNGNPHSKGFLISQSKIILIEEGECRTCRSKGFPGGGRDLEPYFGSSAEK